MVKIKTKKEMNLPELIEWGLKNGITSKEYTCDNKDGYKSVIFDLGGKVHLNRFQTYLADDKYEVEIEKEITEDTEIPKIAELNLCGYDRHEELFMNENKSIKQLLNEVETNNKAFYIMNDDLTMALIWKNGKLVE